MGSLSLYADFWMSQKWWYFWLTEMPLTLLAIIYWLAYPSGYLLKLSDDPTILTNLQYSLLMMNAIVTFWAVVQLGGTLLYKTRPWIRDNLHNDYLKETYLIFQWCMLTGDIFICAAVVPFISLKMNPELGTIISMGVLAGFYGIMRVIFLVMNRN
jgi:hypothetical protein